MSKESIKYWLLARFPRPLVVVLYILKSWAYWAVIYGLILLPSVLLSIYSVDGWKFTPTLTWEDIYWVIAFFTVPWFVIVTIGIILLGVVAVLPCVMIIDSLVSQYKQVNDLLPYREKKGVSND